MGPICKGDDLLDALTDRLLEEWKFEPLGAAPFARAPCRRIAGGR